jgi:hypothetical protein
VSPGEEFAIEYIHSVHQTPVSETFTIVPDGSAWGFLPTEARFYDFGAGMQSELAPGETMVIEDGAIVIRGFSRVLPRLNYIVGTVSDHWLCIKGLKISLRDMCGRNAQVSFICKE